jgi:hypothetical protein
MHGPISIKKKYTEQLYSIEGIIRDELKYALLQVQIF